MAHRLRGLPRSDWTKVREVGMERVGAAIALLVVCLYPFHSVTPLAALKANLCLADPLILVGIPVWCAAAGIKRVRIEYLVCFFLIILLSFSSFLIASFRVDVPVSSVEAIFRIAKTTFAFCWLLFFYYVGSFFKRDMVGWLLSIVALQAALFAVLSVAEAFRSPTRTTGPFADPNIYANYLALGLTSTLLVCEAWAGRLKGALLNGLMVPFLMALSAGLVTTASRSGMLGGCAFALCLVARALRRRTWPVLLQLLVIGGVVYLAALYFRDTFIVRRMTSMLAEGALQESDRWPLLMAIIPALGDNLLFGIGPGQTSTYIGSILGVRLVAHNTYLSWLLELGLAGLFSWLSLYALMIRDAWRLEGFGRGGQIFLAFLVFTLAQALFVNTDNFRSVWIVAGLVAGIRYSEQDTAQGVTCGEPCEGQSESDHHP